MQPSAPPPPAAQPAPPAPAPEAPSPAAAPEASAVTVTVQDGAVPLQGLPRTAQEVRGLQARREVLRDQLTRAVNRREQLVAQLNRGLPDEATTGIEQRLALIDERILQIERDQAATERLLSNASPEVLAQTTVPSYQPGMIDEDDAVFAAFTTFGVGIVLTLVVGRLRRRFGRRRAGKAPPAEALPNDPRLEQLAQAVDAIAVEVERIGEGQRFVTQLLAGRREAAPVMSGEGERP